MTQRDKTERLRPMPHSEHGDQGEDPSKVEAEKGPIPTGGAGRYTILGSIHRGGMGEILLARVEGAEGFTRKLVLKGLLNRLSEDTVSYQLFMREACLMACLDHPNIVRVFDLPYVGDKLYLAMEYLRGRNFHQVIQRSTQAQPKMPVRVALHVAAEALRGLHYAHNAKDESGTPMGIIHRDVSPGNILVSFFGEVKVTDFGIAKIANSPQFTGPRSIRGKARYVAPEQIHGEQASVLSDVYSAGVVLAEALLGEPLWERATVPETLLAIVTEDREKTIDRILKDRPTVPGLRAALRGALALNAHDRFASALQFAETLEAIARNLGGACTHVELGLYVRKLFFDAPDLPADDGFGATGLPTPQFDIDVNLQTDPTVIALEPEWIKEEAKKATASMRPQDPSKKEPKTPHVTPVVESVDLPPPPRRPSFGRSRPASRKALPPPPAEAARIRAEPWPPQAAVVKERAGSGGSASEYSFSELIPGNPTDEEPSRDIERIPIHSRGDLALQVQRRQRSRTPSPPPSDSTRATSAHGLTLLVAGIFIGASLAIAGCVLALILGR